MNTQQILIVEDDINASKVLARILEKEEYIVDTSASAEEAHTMIVGADYDLLIIDMVLPKMDGLTFLRRIKQEYPDVLTLIVTSYGSITTAVEALKAGADDFLEKPLVPEKLLHVIRKVFEEQRLKNEITALKSDLVKRNQFANIVGNHPKMQIIFQLIESLKDTDVSILITGETGTGKELVARAIHYQSRRRQQPFVAINCASIPETLFESELFGYERGAFTGASKRKLGRLEQAEGGTVLLDEIGDMPLSVQAKLLRSIQEKKIERLGSNNAGSIPLNVRILSATNKDLNAEVAQKNFRVDLFYRLNVVPIHIPPLRERIEDVPLLVDHFLTKIARARGQEPPRISERAFSRLMTYPWPGNVREFENVMERAAVLNPGQLIEDIPFLPIDDASSLPFPSPVQVDADLSLKDVCKTALAEVEKQYLTQVLEQYKGSIKLSAEHAKVNVRTIRRKMKEYELDKWTFK